MPKKIRKVIPIQAAPDYNAKVYPRSISGFFTSWRWACVWMTQAVFYGLCWIQWEGHQAILFDLEDSKFYFFDLILWPQDTIYLVLLLVLCALALFLITAIAGRIWCGYACPQTVYTEIFLWMEHHIEGDRPARLRLDAAPWSPRKLRIKVAKHGAWLLFSLWTGITFVGYVVPIRELLDGLMTLDIGGWSAFWVLFYGFATYGNAGFLRDQMCRQICPYARFQFAMLDKDTLIIAYDHLRGDPRGARTKSIDPRVQGLGDCVDCGICVQVCPTGIDIRNGLQNECIGCAACIDACDQVMDKMTYPRGLIRYSTENAVANHQGTKEILHRALRPRVLAYIAIFVSLTAAVAWSLATRVPLKLDVIRDRATLAREVEDGAIENVFQLLVMNTGNQRRTFELSVEGITSIHFEKPLVLTIAGGEIGALTTSVRVDQDSAKTGANSIRFIARDIQDDTVKVVENAKFWMP
ncbi:MAG: hypothetical protein RIR18_846 [Pseudomonadota bacterium]|jgi:cytochrome c oxidase accessory protein FixG